MAAKTRQDVEQQSTRDRIWEAMDYGYGQKRQAINQDYDKAYSQADRQMLSRGMQRSSYGAQTLANINQQRNKALDENWNAQIADYQNRLTEQENLDWQRNFQERQLAQNQSQFEANLGENQRQFNANLGFQRERAAASDTQFNLQFDYGKQRDLVGDQQWQQQFDQSAKQFDTNMAYQRERAAVGDQQWQQQFSANRADTAWNQNYQQTQADRSQSNWEKEYTANRADTAWNQNYQQGRANASDSQWERQFAYGQQRDTVADNQWREQFDYGKKRDTVSDSQWQASFDADRADTARSVAAQYVSAILAKGQMPSAELLAQAGLSEADARAMMAEAAASSGGNRGGNPVPTNNNNDGNDNGDKTPPTDTELVNNLSADFGNGLKFTLDVDKTKQIAQEKLKKIKAMNRNYKSEWDFE